MSRYTPELPTAGELTRVAQLIEHVEDTGTDVTGYQLVTDHGSPWLRIVLTRHMAAPDQGDTWALWRANGTVYALDRIGMVIEDQVLEAAW